MSKNMKALLILILVLGVTTGVVFLQVYGIGNRNEPKLGRPVPSDAAARAYVQEHQLLASVTRTESVVASGPTYMIVTGTDSAGAEKFVWLTGRDKKIESLGSILAKDGVPREQIVAKLAADNVPESEIQYLFAAPYDYNSGKIVWFAQDKSVRHRVFWFDFKTGELIRDDVLDPTAWSLTKD